MNIANRRPQADSSPWKGDESACGLRLAMFILRIGLK